MKQITRCLDSLSKPLLLFIASGLVAILGILDYLIGPELLGFYIAPIFLAARFAGKRAGFLIAIVSAGVWLVANILAGNAPVHPLLPFWNAGMILGIFLVTTYILLELFATRRREEELTRFIVHDLRSPLFNILTGLHMLQRTIEPAGDAEQIEAVEVAIASGEQMAALINSLLDMSRLERKEMPLQLREVLVNRLIEGAFQQVALLAKVYRVTLKADVEPTAYAVSADNILTTRTLVNLLGNALKYSPPDSTVLVRVTTQGAEKIAFSVIDEGPGIPPEWSEKIFDKFAQIEARKEGTPVGNGLGLAFCREATEAQGGHIWLARPGGEGTTITFTLPVAPVLLGAQATVH